MDNLLPFGQKVKIIHKFLEYEVGWITNVAKSLFNGRNWQYEVRTDKRLRSGWFLWGGDWFDEMYLETISDNEEIPKMLNIATPSKWPTELSAPRKPGMWVTNGNPGDTIDKMYSWKPGAITCFYDYLQANQVFQYKEDNPEVPVIVRIQHPKNWQENPIESAKNLGKEVASKWQDLEPLDPCVYFCNEMNLHYENGDDNPANQYLYETKEFYQKYAEWVRVTADTVKNLTPKMKLITPPFAFGHNEDGEPDDTGSPKIGWAGYDYLVDTINTYFDNILTFHAYWGDNNGSHIDRLYDPEISSWYAYRWKRVLDLFETQYGMNCKMIIDEAGNFAVTDEDFTVQVVDFAKECFKDNRVEALTYFLWSDPTQSPGNLPNSWVDNLTDNELDEHLTVLRYYGSESEIEPPDPEPEPLPEPEPETKMTIKVTYEKSGLPLIVGSYPHNVPILVQPPYGNFYTVIAGSKPEHGTGGFEAGYANMNGNYSLTIEGDKYEVYSKADGSLIRVEFVENSEPQEQVFLKSVLIDKELANEIMLAYPDIFTIVNSKFEALYNDVRGFLFNG